MRPSNSAGLESVSRPRKQSTGAGSTHAPSAGPTTFLLASESDLARRPSTTSTTTKDVNPVRTLQETLDELNSPTKVIPNKATTSPQPRRDGSRRRSTIRPRSIEQLRHEALRNQSGIDTHSSGALTPSLPPSQGPSLPSSPKSISSRSIAKSEDELSHDGYSSQAIESGDEEENDHDLNLSTSMDNSAPQLIMPSIRIPSRRPFTERGKQLGRFKIMFVGSKGSGKTSLIKSIVQVCEDIVHVDPITSSLPSTSKSSMGKSSANAFRETHASTRPYPSWWSDVDESRVLKRRKSMGDSVLERNICFVDTSHSKAPAFAATYIEQQLLRTINSANQASPELTSLLSGRGGSQVDLVLYLVSHSSLHDDIGQIQQLSTITNVVPLISKSDLLTDNQITEIREALPFDLCALPRLPINFGSLPTYDPTEPQASAPYAVACVNGPDFDNMDASLLMSSEYIQPLLPSELYLLVAEIFKPENVAYLRHTAAKKLLDWHNTGTRFGGSAYSPSVSSAHAHSITPSTLNSPLQPSLPTSHGLVQIRSHSPMSLNTSNSFALARVADHTQKEERLAQIRLSKWASDLQLSLQRERERYESIARSERAIWLVERMGEEIKEGQLVPLAAEHDQEVEDRRGRRSKKVLYRDVRSNVTYQVHDPLGLLRWQDAVRSQTWLALQVVGSFGVVGGLALWITKQWGYDSTFHQWARDWGVWHD